MKKRSLLTITCLLSAFLIAGCSQGSKPSDSAPSSAAATAASEESAAAPETSSPADESPEDTESPAANDSPSDSSTETESATVRVGSLKGPTSMGLVFMMEMAEGGKTENEYEFTMVTAADELLPKIISGDVDIALVPANVASILYNQTNGNVSVIDINTLGVLYVVSGDASIQSLEDLKGKTVYMTGKGTTPDYVVQYLLDAHGLTDQVALEFKSEPAEVAALLSQQPEAVGVLPQPFATVACVQSGSKVQAVLDLNQAWSDLQENGGSRLVTGVTLVRNQFLEENKEAVEFFLKDHEKSAAYTKEQPDQSAELIVKTGIIGKAPIAKMALPLCNITCITGQEMEEALKGYLQVLYERDEKSVGGALPEDDFYYYE